MPIQVLPTHLVNKIAAGEVIERPASVVKELVENALDAEPTRVEIAVEDGGRRLIAISDDGGGMDADDLALAFAPHATSKIAAEDDLFAIETMGFRGEALASVAAVAHAHIRSRRRGDDAGHEVAAGGGKLEPVRPCAAAPGTTVTVRDLFYNTPARRKFMRSANTEFGHVVEQLARLSLPFPKVGFRLTHNGREAKHLPPADSTLRRVADLFGRDVGTALLPIRPRGGTVHVAGLIGLPSLARASARWQYFFLNGRYVRDRVLAHALREAYRGLLDSQRSPVAFIFLEIDPAEVDVNVHPTKIEVRFRNGQAVHGELLAALRETLNQSNLSPSANLGAAATDAATEAEPAEAAGADETATHAGEGGGRMDEARRASLREALADFFKSVPPTQPALSFPAGHGPAPRPGAPWRPVVPLAGAARDTAPPQPPPRAARPAPPPRAIQIHNTYIVAATDEGLVVIDQHALHERLIYNDLKRRLAGEGSSGLTSQRLLIPEALKVTPAEADALEQSAELLARLGIEVAPFGPDTVAVQRFPALLAERGAAAGEFVRELLDRLAEDTAMDRERLLEDVLAMLACKAAVKAGDALRPEEIADLLARRAGAEKGSACPHGRPTTLTLTVRELEKQFRRT